MQSRFVRRQSVWRPGSSNGVVSRREATPCAASSRRRGLEPPEATRTGVCTLEISASNTWMTNNKQHTTARLRRARWQGYPSCTARHQHPRQGPRHTHVSSTGVFRAQYIPALGMDGVGFALVPNAMGTCPQCVTADITPFRILLHAPLRRDQ